MTTPTKYILIFLISKNLMDFTFIFFLTFWNLVFSSELSFFYDIELDLKSLNGPGFSSWDVWGDYLITSEQSTFDVWNSSSASFLYSIEKTGPSAVTTNSQYLSIISGSLVKNYRITDGQYVNNFNARSNILFIATNSKNFYFINQERNLEVRDRTSGHLILFFNRHLFYEVTATVENMYVITKNSLNSHLYHFIRMNSNGSVIWNISSELYITNIRESYPHIFYSQDRGIVQANINDGSVLLPTASGGQVVQDILVEDNFVYALLGNYIQLQFIKSSLKFVAKFGYEEMDMRGSMLKKNKNFLFYMHCNITKEHIGYRCNNPRILQWNLTTEEKTLNFIFSPVSPINRTSFTMIQNPISQSEINTASFTQRYNSIRTKWPESSFFTPFIFKDANESLHLIFFGGAQNMCYWSCNYPAIMDIQITNNKDYLDGSEHFKYDMWFSSPIQQKNMVTLIDYAAVNILIENIVFYILHGGYVCFSSAPSSRMYLITIGVDLKYSFERVKQSKAIR
jgi:hypothetical protein